MITFAYKLWLWTLKWRFLSIRHYKLDEMVLNFIHRPKSCVRSWRCSLYGHTHLVLGNSKSLKSWTRPPHSVELPKAPCCDWLPREAFSWKRGATWTFALPYLPRSTSKVHIYHPSIHPSISSIVTTDDKCSDKKCSYHFPNRSKS